MLTALLSVALAAEAPFAGTYALTHEVVTVAKVPVFRDVRSRAVVRSLLTVRRDGDRLLQRQEICAFTLDSRSLVGRTVLPAAFVRAMPIREREIHVTPAGEGWRYEADLGPLPVGWDPARGPLPTRLDDPAVADTDRDGRPGATVLVRVPVYGNVRVYVAQESHLVLRGTLGADGGVTGTIAPVTLASSVLDADVGLLARSPEVRFDADASGFRIEPVAAGTTCDALRDGR